jgi:hypothetical protein
MKVISNIATATILLFSSLAVAQTEVPTFTIGNLKLEETTFQVGLYTEGAGASCDTACDGAFSPLVAPIEVTCPAKAGETCTFAVSVDAAGRSAGQTEGAFRYVGDAQTTVIQNVPETPPNSGFYMWSLLAAGPFSASHTFGALVKNTKISQKHLVEIDLGCFVQGGQGSCFVQALGLFEQDHNGSPVTVTIQVFRERKAGT